MDSFGCTTDTSIFIAEPDSIVAQIYLNTYPICSYDSTWIYLDSISGGVAPYSYQWTDGTSSDSIYVAGGFNRVFVTDANGCLDSTNGINVIIPSNKPLSVSSAKDAFDPILSGRYLITSLHHKVTPTESNHTMVMTVMKDSVERATSVVEVNYPEPPQGPVKVTEGLETGNLKPKTKFPNTGPPGRSDSSKPPFLS